MVIATLMTVLIHGCVIDSLIDVGRGRRISKETAPKIKRDHPVNGGWKGAGNRDNPARREDDSREVRRQARR